MAAAALHSSVSRIFSIFRAVAEDYICLIDVDLETERELQYMLRNTVYHELPHWSDAEDYHTCIAAYAEMLIVEEDRRSFLQATSLPQLKAFLACHREFVIEYNVRLDGERRRFQGRFTLGSAEDGSPHMFIGIRDITETRQYEARSREMAEYERFKEVLNSEITDKRTLLLIDGDRAQRDRLREQLSDTYHILEASNGAEGLALLREQYRVIALAVLDVRLAEIDGYELLRIAQEDSLLSAVPMIVTTTLSGAEEECLKLGAADFVAKPFNVNVLRRRIRGIFRLRESAATLAAVEYDELTGLYTRQAFFHFAESVLRQHPEEHYCLLVSDIEGFKRINEHYGSDMADAVLVAIADRLRRRDQEHVVTGRLNGDRFVALVRCAEENVNRALLEERLDNLTSDLPVPNIEVKYGLYEKVDLSVPVSAACDRAIMALNTVKHIYGERFGTYSAEIQKRADWEHMVEKSMREAYEKDQFRVYYQPKHDAATGRLIGAEALIRWEHPEYGFILPGDFIPVFERTRFVSWADYFVWRRSCENLRRWMDAGIRVVPVSVNASRADFSMPDFLGLINRAADRNRVPYRLLHIEVTETVFSDDVAHIIRTLEQCRELGYCVELDDFGSGYSSLNTLAELPLDVVKMDMSFMRQLDNPRRKRILAACIALAGNMQMRTLCEGVETEEQLELVRRFGADAVQGYYFSRPMPEDEFERYLIRCAEKEAAEGAAHGRIEDPDSRLADALKVLGSRYESVYEVDLDRDLCIPLRLDEDGPVQLETMLEIPYSALLRDCIEHIVVEGQQNLMPLMEPDYVIDLLSRREHAAFLYRGRKGSEIRYYEFRVFRLEPFRSAHRALMALVDVEEDQTRSREVFAALTREYGPLFLIDLDSGALTLCRSTERESELPLQELALSAGGYREFIDAYAARYVAQGWREPFLLQAALPFLAENLRKDELFKIPFVLAEGDVPAQLCAGPVPRQDGARQVVFGIRKRERASGSGELPL